MPRDSTIIFGLIEQALRLPQDQRRPFLEKACANDPEALADVLGMLTVVEHDLLEAETIEPGPGGSAAVSPASGGSQRDIFNEFELHARQVAEPRGGTGDESGYWIGPYRLLSLLGEGGFGAVFLAERRRPVRFRVALKVIRPGMDTRQVLARFEQERQVLALMDHPGIARVLDAGETLSGRPYFAMEFVPGRQVTKFCDAERLSIPARLEVFRLICEAVQHAHDRGVIHRDLKPGNILARMIDGKPVVKVIDFGIAKATMHVQSAGEIYTREGVLVGTPEYMSPEQADPGSRDIDTRTDVFSLGVILYELIAGTLPIASGTLRGAQMLEAYRIIREQERPRASTRLSQLERLTPEELETARRLARERGQATPDAAVSEMLAEKKAEAERVARERQIGIDELRRRLRRELDWILQKSLELPRNRRYDSPRALAEDVGRYLRGDAIQARPPTPGYTFRKFVRRNRVAVGTATAIAAAILSGAGVAVWKWREAVAERNATDGLLSFMNTAVVGAASGDGPRGPIPIPRTTIDEAARRFESDFARRPAIRRRVNDTFATAYLAAGVPSGTVDLLGPSAGRLSGAELSASGALALGTALMRLRRAGEARSVLAAAVARAAPSDEETIRLRERLAGALKWSGDFADSRRMYAEARSQVSSTRPPDAHEWLLQLEYDLVLLDRAETEKLAEEGRIDGQERRLRLERTLERMDELARVSAGPPRMRDEKVLMTRFERAGLRAGLGLHEEAVADGRPTVAEMEELLGPRHWRTLEARSRLATWLLKLDRSNEAVPLFERAYAGYRATEGDKEDETIKAGMWLARAQRASGDRPGALRRFRDVFESAERDGADPAVLADRATRAAELCAEWGEPDEAAYWRDRSSAWRTPATPPP